MGVEIKTKTQAVKVETRDGHILSVTSRNGEVFRGDAFVDASGTSATPGNCVKYGNGCAMCILRCHSFFPRVSLTALAGVEEWNGRKKDGSIGAMSSFMSL